MIKALKNHLIDYNIRTLLNRHHDWTEQDWQTKNNLLAAWKNANGYDWLTYHIHGFNPYPTKKENHAPLF